MGDKKGNEGRKKADKDAAEEAPSYWDQMSKPRIITPKFDAAAVYAFSSGVTEEGLKGPVSDRVLELAKPSERNVTKKFDPADYEIPTVKSAALNAQPTSRINGLSLPKKGKLQANVEAYKEEFPELIPNIQKYQDLQSKSDYRKLDHQCPKTEPEMIYTRSEMYKSKYKPKKVSPKKAKKELKQWVKERSKPKRQFPQPELNRGPMKPLRELGPRMIQLAVSNPRSVTVRYSQQSISEMGVSPNALKAHSSRRTDELAHPRYRVKKFSSQPMGSGVRKSALQANASERVKELAEPRADPSPPPKENVFSVSEAAKNGNASGRVEELAKPMHVTEKYQKDEEMHSGVKESALNASASGRTEELAKPREDQSAPPKKNVYNVKKAALNAQASSRIKQLAKPIKR